MRRRGRGAMPRIIVLILAGGRVDELGVLTHLRPKATMPFGGLYRIIDFPLSSLMHSGIERVGILSQYRASSLVEHIGSGASWDMTGRHRGITLLPPFQGHRASDWYKGSADAVFQNLDFIDAHKPDLVMIASGDHVHNMDYGEMVRFHQDMDADVTAAFVELPDGDLSRFGLARIADDDPRGGRILEYREKPAKPISAWASMTVYLFRTAVLDRVLRENAGEPSHEFGRDIIPTLVGSSRFYGYRFAGYWAYSRTLDEYWECNMELLRPEPRIRLEEWGLRTNLDHEDIRSRCPAIIGPRASIEKAVLHNGIRVEGRVENSLLFPGVHVEEGALVRDSILFFDTHVGPGVTVERSITDIGVTLGKGSSVGKPGGRLSVVGTRAQIPMGVQIGEGSSVYPGVTARDFTERGYPAGAEVMPSGRP